MDEAVLQWISAHRDYALLVVPAVAFLEAMVGVGIFVSGIFLLSICTYLYVEQLATLPEMLPLAFIGALLSDHTGYYLGRWLGPRFHQLGFVKNRAERVQKAEAMIRKYGEAAIIIGRLLTMVRSLVPLVTGVSGVTRLRYTMFDLLACLIWTTGLGLLVIGLDWLF